MRQLGRSVLVALAATALATVAVAQAPPAGKPSSPAPKTTAPPAGKAAPKASPDEVLATVNKDKVTRGEVVDYLSKYEIPSDATHQQMYEIAVNSLINTKLVFQFLEIQKISVSEKQVDDEVAQFEKDLKANSLDLNKQMAQTGTSMTDLRNTFRRRLAWKNHVMRVSDAELRKFVEENKDALSGAQVRANHILLMVDPNAKPEEKQRVKQKLLDIKKEIESGKTTFAEAANKYSEDPLNVQSKSGGDLDFFPRKGLFIEPFSAAAFTMKKGETSDPIETPYGYHLIQVTDRREGQPVDLAQHREAIINMYAADLQEKIIADGRKTAKIDIKPMPADLFQEQPETNSPAPAAAKAATPAEKSAPR